MRKRSLTLIFGFVCLVGCSSKPATEMPAVHAVKGQLLKGGKPAAAGSLRFVPKEGAEQIFVNAAVDDSGRFELYTLKDTTKVTGAPVGTYQVTYTMMSKEQSATGPVSLPDPVKIEANTTELTLKLP